MQPLVDYAGPDACLLHLVRHGATPPNELDPPIMQGDAIDEPLSDLGRRQAARAAAALAGRPITAVYSSPLRRAFQTAEAIADRLGVAVCVVPGLTEVNVGRWEGLTWPEVELREPDLYRRFRESPESVAYPGGESLLEVLERVAAALSTIAAERLGEEVVAVAHSVVNRVYLGDLMRVPLREGRELAQANCSISRVRYEGGLARVVSMNEVGHLLNAGR